MNSTTFILILDDKLVRKTFANIDAFTHTNNQEPVPAIRSQIKKCKHHQITNLNQFILHIFVY